MENNSNGHSMVTLQLRCNPAATVAVKLQRDCSASGCCTPPFCRSTVLCYRGPMKIRTRFTARVVRFCDLPGRTRKRERHAELAVESMDGQPRFLTVQVPYRGGLARAGVQEGNLISFTATHTGEESEQRMSYLFDVVVMQRAAAAVVPVPVVPSLPAAMPPGALMPASGTTESFTTRVDQSSSEPGMLMVVGKLNKYSPVLCMDDVNHLIIEAGIASRVVWRTADYTLRAEIEQHRPTVILACGSAELQTLTGKVLGGPGAMSFFAAAGQVHSMRLSDGTEIPVVIGAALEEPDRSTASLRKALAVVKRYLDEPPPPQSAIAGPTAHGLRS